MTAPGEPLADLREKLAKAKLIARYREGDRLGAFRTAKPSDPQLAAAFATEFAEDLRGSLRPASQRRRAAILLQAAELLRGSPAAKSPEGSAAIAWLLTEATFAEERERNLRLGAQVMWALLALGALLLLLTYV
jgi:hypothetical protein